MSDSVQLAQTPAKLTVSVVETEAEFLLLESVWNKLLLASPRPVPFLTWEWISTWWKHFREGSRLFVLVARDSEKQVVGIAPLRIAVRKARVLVPVRTLEFIGYRGSVVCTDYLDFLSAAENREQILRTLAGAILSRGRDWDMVLLADAPEESALLGILKDHATSLHFHWREYPSEVCPWISLPSTWQSLLGTLSSRDRKFLKSRRLRLSGKFAVEVSRCEDAEHVHEYMETLARLHRSSRQRKGQPGNFSVREYLDFHYEVAERMARAGYLYMAQLRCNARPVAAFYGFQIGTVLFGYQQGYDADFAAHGVGGVLGGLVIEDAIKRLHAAEYDLLRGEESYKYVWAKNQRKTRAIVVWNRSLAGELSKWEFLLRRRYSPWIRRIQNLRKSVTQRLRSVNAGKTDAAPGESQE